MLDCFGLILACVAISGGTSKSDPPDSDSVFGINSGADYNAEVHSDSGVYFGDDFAAISLVFPLSESTPESESTWESQFAPVTESGLTPQMGLIPEPIPEIDYGPTIQNRFQ